MEWLILFFAGVLEIVWAIGLKYRDGFTKLWPTVDTIAAMAGSFFLLSYALKTIPVGTAYTVWTGIGAVGVAAIGMIALGEPRTAVRIACILLIVIGIVGLKFFGGAQPLVPQRLFVTGGDDKNPQANGLLGVLLGLLVAEKSGFQAPESPELAGLQSLAEEMTGRAVSSMKESLAEGKLNVVSG